MSMSVGDRLQFEEDEAYNRYMRAVETERDEAVALLRELGIAWVGSRQCWECRACQANAEDREGIDHYADCRLGAFLAKVGR